eukprot:15360199-Ditylum_brightwellii.AAC.1
MAATDNSESGRKFFKFTTNYDFTSERGKKAAEKNAYSLLRKRKYLAAATFFLLPEPPMLNTALDVIVTKMKDLSLAFFVARLINNPICASSGNGLGGNTLTIGGNFSLGSIGGGAGFAGSAMMSGSTFHSGSETVDEVKYENWNPVISDDARKLLNGHGAKIAKDDTCLETLRLIWLGRCDDASLCLSGCSVNEEDGKVVTDDLAVPPSFGTHDPSSQQRSSAMNRMSELKQSSSEKSANLRVLTKAN